MCLHWIFKKITLFLMCFYFFLQIQDSPAERGQGWCSSWNPLLVHRNPKGTSEASDTHLNIHKLVVMSFITLNNYPYSLCVYIFLGKKSCENKLNSVSQIKNDILVRNCCRNSCTKGFKYSAAWYKWNVQRYRCCSWAIKEFSTATTVFY